MCIVVQKIDTRVAALNLQSRPSPTGGICNLGVDPDWFTPVYVNQSGIQIKNSF